MRSFLEVIDALKEYLSSNKNIKILDKDVAKALNISQSNFATIKRRNSIPYEHILLFCHKEELCCNTLFFK